MVQMPFFFTFCLLFLRDITFCLRYGSLRLFWVGNRWLEGATMYVVMFCKWAPEPLWVKFLPFVLSMERKGKRKTWKGPDLQFWSGCEKRYGLCNRALIFYLSSQCTSKDSHYLAYFICHWFYCHRWPSLPFFTP
jgi:hypothetical protein